MGTVEEMREMRDAMTPAALHEARERARERSEAYRRRRRYGGVSVSIEVRVAPARRF